MIRPAPLLLLAFIALAMLVMPARAQESAYRFEITAVGDSTVTIAIGDHPWVHAGLTGIAVDPMRRDALVARLRVMTVRGPQAVAVVTGQTTKLSTEHVALLERPRAHWYQQTTFWLGTFLGVVIGAVAAH